MSKVKILIKVVSDLINKNKTLNYLKFVRDYYRFKRMNQKIPGMRCNWNERNACLTDRTPSIPFDLHYMYHPVWAIKKVIEINPKKHIDISSILHFSATISLFVPTEFYDYRPANVLLNNLKVGQADLLNLPFGDESVESVSCMHTVEHVGLGRYGDPLDPEADRKAMSELQRVVKKGGNLLFVVPMGKPRIIFNAHRIYKHQDIINSFKDFELKEFALIPDEICKTGYMVNPTKEFIDKQIHGCGCYWFVKKNG